MIDFSSAKEKLLTVLHAIADSKAAEAVFRPHSAKCPAVTFLMSTCISAFNCSTAERSRQVQLAKVCMTHSSSTKSWNHESCVPCCHLTANLMYMCYDRALRRARHHCRLCGGIFCATCSCNFLLLPPKFQKNQPERLCSACATLMQPLQPFLAGNLFLLVDAAVQ